MQPDHGGRIDLVLERSDREHVVYAAKIATSERIWTGHASIAVADGSLDSDLSDAPNWLFDLMRGVLRAAWRAHEQSAWPRRITRWRPAPEPS